MAGSEKQPSNNYEKLLDLQSKLLKLGYDEAAGTPGTSFGYQYLSFQKIKSMIQPYFVEYGWVLTQPTEVRDGKNVLKTQIYDVEQQKVFLEDEFILCAREESNPQDWGKAITYFRRYTFLTLVGLVADKDDDCFVTDGEIKDKLADMDSLDEITKYFKTFDKDRQRFISKYFTERKEQIIEANAVKNAEKVAEKAAENATVEM